MVDQSGAWWLTYGSSITGPYRDRNGVRLPSGGGTEVLATHGGVVGPGHQALVADSDGWLMAHHYYTSAGSRPGVNLSAGAVAGPPSAEDPGSGPGGLGHPVGQARTRPAGVVPVRRRPANQDAKPVGHDGTSWRGARTPHTV